MAKVIRIHHVALAVKDIEESLKFWRDALGIQPSQVEEVPEQQSSVAFLPAGESEIELVKPITEDSSLARFLAERGPGMHHICLEVDDLEEMLAGLKKKDIRLIQETPVILHNRKIAFIHPKSAQGVLVELYEAIQREVEDFL